MFPNQTAFLLSMLVAVSLGIGGYVYGQHTEHNADLVAFQHATAEAQANYSAALHAADLAREQAETRLATETAADAANYQTMKEKYDADLSKALAAVRAGSKRVYVNATCPTDPAATAGADNGALPQSAADSAVDQHTSRVQLSPADGEFLERFAGECDATADKLNFAIQQLMVDRAFTDKRQ